ncbi:MAG: hypothetical protein Kow0090_15150 [Myxococcota bacterium]
MQSAMVEKENDKKEGSEMQQEKVVKSEPQPALPLNLGSPTLFRGSEPGVEITLKKEMPLINGEEVKLVEKNEEEFSKEELKAGGEHIETLENRGGEESVPPVISETPPPPLPVVSKEKVAEKLREGELPPIPEIKSDTLITGKVLRQMREALGLSLDDVRKTTKITRHWLETIEADKYGDLPSLVYVRGYISALARMYGIPEKQAIDTFLERVKKFLGG